MAKPRVLAAVAGLLFAIVPQAHAQETPRYDVVAEYIREMGVTKANQDVGKKELAEAKTQRDNMMNAIRNSTRVKLALAENIHSLQSMKLNPPFETLLPNTVEFYKQKLELHENLITIATAFSTDKPKPGVDYGNLAATMPQITATLEYIDQSLFKLTPLVFLMLVDEKPDTQGQLRHLTITKKQAQQLVASIDAYFGSSLNDKNQDWNVSAASVLKSGLTRKDLSFAVENQY